MQTTTNTETVEFETIDSAWLFMRETDEKAGRIVCGYPSLKRNLNGMYTVRVAK